MDKPNMLGGSLDRATSQPRQQALISQLGQDKCAQPTGKLLQTLSLLTWGMYMTDQNCPLRKPSRAGGTRCSSASHT